MKVVVHNTKHQNTIHRIRKKCDNGRIRPECGELGEKQKVMDFDKAKSKYWMTKCGQCFKENLYL